MARGKTNSINGSQAVATKAARGKAAPGKAASGRNGAGKKTAGKSKKARANTGANGYRPSEGEPFMNPRMREYFRRKLLDWKAELLEESNETIHNLQEGSSSEPDLADRASLETDRSLELRTRDRERKLIAKIDQALERIDEGSYGYCEETEEPIALRRLEARPIATLSLEAQERHERMERTHRDE
jgi:DnaK suppressor protein